MDQPSNSPAPAKPVNNDHLIAALSYVSILFIIPLMKRDSEFCQYHAKQGIVLFIVWIIVSMLYWIPMGYMIVRLLSLALLIVDIIAIVKALGGEKWELPLIGKYASQIKL